MMTRYRPWFALLFGITSIPQANAAQITPKSSDDCSKLVFINVPPGRADEYLGTCLGRMLNPLIATLPPRDISKLSDLELKARLDLYVERISGGKVGRFETWYLSDLIFGAYAELLRRTPEKRQLFDIIDYAALRRAQEASARNSTVENDISDLESRLTPEGRAEAADKYLALPTLSIDHRQVADKYLLRNYNVSESVERAMVHYRAAVELDSLAVASDSSDLKFKIQAEEGLGTAYGQRRYGSRIKNLQFSICWLQSAINKTDLYERYLKKTGNDGKLNEVRNNRYAYHGTFYHLGRSYLDLAGIYRDAPTAPFQGVDFTNGCRIKAITDASKAYSVPQNPTAVRFDSPDEMRRLAIENLEKSYGIRADARLGAEFDLVYHIPGNTPLEIARRDSIPGATRLMVGAKPALYLAKAYAEQAITGGDAWFARAVDLLSSWNAKPVANDNYMDFPYSAGRIACALGDTLIARARSQSDQTLAGAAARDALAAYQKGTRIFTAMRALQDRLICVRGLANADMMLGDWPAAEAAANEAVGLMAMVEGGGDFGPDLEEALDFGQGISEIAAYASWRNGNSNGAWDHVEEGRARTFTLLLKAQLSGARGGEASNDLIYQRQILTLSKRTEGPSSDGLSALGDLKIVLEKLLKLRSDAIKTEPLRAALTLDGTFSAALQRVDAVIAPVMTEVGGVILVAEKVGEKTKFRAFAAPGLNTKSFSKAMQVWRRAYYAASAKGRSDDVQEQWLAEIEKLNRVFGDIFGNPLATALSQIKSETKQPRVLFLLPGPLSALPIGLLTGRESKDAIGERFIMSFSPTVSAFNIARPLAPDRRPRPSNAVVATISTSNSVGSLEGEIVSATLARYGPVDNLSGPSATEAKFFGAISKAAIVHVASHAVFYPDRPDDSGINLSNDVVISATSLATSERVNALDLVFLAACETGLTYSSRSPERFSGLPAAVLGVGARSVVATLWRVPDVSATFFSSYFYQKYGEGRKAAPDALRETQTWLKSATTLELNGYLAKVIEQDGLSSAQIDQFYQYLQNFQPDDRPFARPYYWASYIAFGG